MTTVFVFQFEAAVRGEGAAVGRHGRKSDVHPEGGDGAAELPQRGGAVAAGSSTGASGAAPAGQSADPPGPGGSGSSLSSCPTVSCAHCSSRSWTWRRSRRGRRWPSCRPAWRWRSSGKRRRARRPLPSSRSWLRPKPPGTRSRERYSATMSNHSPCCH